MTTHAEREAKRILRGDVAENLPQVQMAEETLRLLRDGDRMNKEAGEKFAATRGVGMEQRIINVLGGIVLTFLGWWSNNIWQTVQTMQNQVTQLNVELARNYAPRLEMQGNFDRIYSKLDQIEKQTKGQR